MSDFCIDILEWSKNNSILYNLMDLKLYNVVLFLKMIWSHPHFIEKICMKLFISWFSYQHKFQSDIWHVWLKCIKFWDEYQRKCSLFKTNLCFVWVYLVWGKVTLWMVATSAANYAFCNKKKVSIVWYINIYIHIIYWFYF